MTTSIMGAQTLIHITQLAETEQHSKEVIDIPMTSEDRQRVHRRITAKDGQNFALKLATGSVLRVGQTLFSSADTLYKITAAAEDVLSIKPKTLAEAAYIGHLIGNLHRDIDIIEGEIIALWNAPLERKLSKAQLSYKREQRPFNGRPAGEHSH